MFDRVLKHVEYFDIKFPISLPSLIYVILIKKKPDIVIGDNVIIVPPSPLNFSYKFFTGKHILDIVLPNLPNF